MGSVRRRAPVGRRLVPATVPGRGGAATTAATAAVGGAGTVAGVNDAPAAGLSALSLAAAPGLVPAGLDEELREVKVTLLRDAEGLCHVFGNIGLAQCGAVGAAVATTVAVLGDAEAGAVRLCASCRMFARERGDGMLDLSLWLFVLAVGVAEAAAGALEDPGGGSPPAAADWVRLGGEAASWLGEVPRVGTSSTAAARRALLDPRTAAAVAGAVAAVARVRAWWESPGGRGWLVAWAGEQHPRMDPSDVVCALPLLRVTPRLTGVVECVLRSTTVAVNEAGVLLLALPAAVLELVVQVDTPHHTAVMAGPRAAGDSAEVFDIAIRLWDQHGGGPCASLESSLAAARLMVADGG